MCTPKAVIKTDQVEGLRGKERLGIWKRLPPGLLPQFCSSSCLLDVTIGKYVSHSLLQSSPWQGPHPLHKAVRTKWLPTSCPQKKVGSLAIMYLLLLFTVAALPLNKRFLGRVRGVFVSVWNTSCHLCTTIQEPRFLHCTSSREQWSSLGLQYTSEASSMVQCLFTLREKHTDRSAASRTDSAQGSASTRKRLKK